MNPLVSVVVPTFNRLKYLREALDSVFRQTYPRWELIIADDGSDEDTLSYLRGLAAPPRVRLINLAHTGRPAVVRNAAVREAAGEYVAFLDSDDLWADTKIEEQLAVLQIQTHCQWCYTAFTRVNARGDVLPEERGRRWVPYDGDIFEPLLRGAASIRTPSVLAARTLLLQASGFDESVHSAEDFDLWMRLALRSHVAVVDESLVRVRLHEENYSDAGSSAYIGQDHTFRKLQPFVDRHRRSLLRRERARNALRGAASLAAAGRRLSALRALAGSLPYSWSYTEWWLGAARIVLRTAAPERLLVVYRRHLRGNT